MTGLEYAGWQFTEEEAGAWVYEKEDGTRGYLRKIPPARWYDGAWRQADDHERWEQMDGSPALRKGEAEALEQLEILVDPEISGYDTDVRRPYFQMRGKTVTREQAFEIIRRTDRFFDWNVDWQELQKTDYAGSGGHFGNNWIMENFYPQYRGWCRPDGIIGINDIMGKYPNMDEFIPVWLGYMRAFPWLELVIGITDCNEILYDGWEGDHGWWNGKPDESKILDFYERIEIGIWVHEGKLELMSPERTRRIYREYERKYEWKDSSIYDHYCQDHGFSMISDSYLRRMIAALELEEDKVLPPQDTWGYKRENHLKEEDGWLL